MEADSAGEELVRKHDFESDDGCFLIEYEDDSKDPGYIVQNGSVRVKVPIPEEFKGQALKIKHNESEDEACLVGKYSDPLVRRIFQSHGINLPTFCSAGSQIARTSLHSLGRRRAPPP